MQSEWAMACHRAILWLILGLLLSSCTSEARKARSEVVSGCKEMGATSAVCNCVYDKLEDHFGEDSMINMTRGTPIPGFPEQLVLAANACRDE